MKAISTKYHGPTNTRGSRISASDSDHNRITVSFNSELDTDANHDAAAKALCVKMGWTNHPLMRGCVSSDGYVYVFDAHSNRVRFTEDEKAKGQARERGERIKRMG